MDSPLLTVITLSYNHQAFIRQCIEGVLAQEITFPMEYIIHDDASTDGTVEILCEYQARHPDLIRLILQPENQFSKGIYPMNRVLPLARGRYIALCEGDDYWTNPRKLQAQVDYLEAHPATLFCTTRYRRTRLDDEGLEEALLPHLFDAYANSAGLVPLNRHWSYHADWFTQTLTAMMRREALPSPGEIAAFSAFYDAQRYYIMLMRGQGVCLPLVSGVYRQHAGGIYAGQASLDRFHRNVQTFEELWGYTRDPLFLYAHARNALRLRRAGQGHLASPSLARLYPRNLHMLLLACIRFLYLRLRRGFA